MIELLAGLIVGLLILLLLHLTNRLRDSNTLIVLMAVIALIYPVFAIFDLNVKAFAFHSLVAAVFLWVLWLRRNDSMIFVGILLAAHGSFDNAVHRFISFDVGPSWYPHFCGVVDYVLAIAFLYIFYPRKAA